MTAFQKGIFCIALCIGALWFCRLSKSDMTLVYPDNCVFVIDHFFSQPMQLEIKDFIDAAYKKNKSPSNLLPRIESHFPAIKSVVIDMLHPEFLNFSITTYLPIFLLNDEHVICQYDKMFDKSVFAQDYLAKLQNISFDHEPTQKDIELLRIFFESLTDPILQDFSIRWINKHAIWLDQKQGSKEDFSLLVGYDRVPTSTDVAHCRNLRGQISDKPCKDTRGRPCKNNKTWVCDLRFDRQIILFSTNKGV